MQFIGKIVVIVTALVFCAPASARAEQVAKEMAAGSERTIECGDSVTAEILGVLLNTENIDATEYETFCARLREGDGAPPPVVVGSITADPTWEFKWNNGFNLSRSDNAFKLKLGGRIQLDSGVLSLNGGLKDDFRTAEIDPRHGSGAEFRRARIFFSGDVYDRAFFKMQYDFAGDGDDVPDFKDVYIGLKKLGPVGSMKVGHFKEPLFLQEATSSKYITFMERGLNSAFYPGRNVGVMVDGNLAKKRVFWQLGIFRDTNDQGFAFDRFGNEKWDVASRLSVAPIYSDDGEHVLHLGAGYIHRFLDASGDNLRFRARPAAHLAQRFADTQSFPAFETDILNVELAYVHGPFSMQTEFTHTWIQGAAGQEDLEFQGAYVFVSFFVTGEHRTYDFGRGRFGRVKPRTNFDPAKGNWGALEIAVRYSYLDLVSRNIDGGDLWDVTAGINWYLFPNLRWMLNYVHADVSNRVALVEPEGAPAFATAIDGAADLVETRIQIDF